MEKELSDKELLSLVLTGLTQLSLKVEIQENLLRKHLGEKVNISDVPLSDCVRNMIQSKDKIIEEFKTTFN